MAGAYPGFCSMKQLRVLVLPGPPWDASPAVCRRYPVPWVERDHVGKVSCLRNNTMTGTGR